MADGRREGQPRTARRYPTDQNCPRPTSEARRLLILVYLKPAPRHVVPGAAVRDGPAHSPAVDSWPLGGADGHRGAPWAMLPPGP